MSLPYFPLYPADFEADTSHLTMLEDGAYNRLLRLCWMTAGCSLPDDEEWIMRRARARSEEEREAVRVVLAEFFVKRRKRVLNKRLYEEHNRAKNRSAKLRENGSKGGRPRKALKENEKEKATANQQQSNSPHNQSQNQIHKEEVDANASMPIKPPDRLPRADLAEAVEVFNEQAVRSGWPTVQRLSEARSRALRARLSDAGGLDGWRHAVERAGQSQFISSQFRGFGFDWMVKQQNFTKIMEGNYDDRDRPNSELRNPGAVPGASRPGRGAAEAFAAVAERMSRSAG